MKSYTWRPAIINSTLHPTTRHVLLTLSCHVNDAGEPTYPSTRTIARECGLSERSAVTHLQLAAKAGWLKVSKHGYAGQKWARNEYYPRVPDDFEPYVDPEKGTERNSVPSSKPPRTKLSTKALKDVQHLREKGTEGGSVPFAEALNVATEGTEPHDKKALKDVQSNYPSELPNELKDTQPASPAAVDNSKEDGTKPQPVDDFERFWDAWPPTARRTDKRKCRELWQTHGIGKFVVGILLHIEALKKTAAWKEGHEPSPFTYLSNGRWEDGMPAIEPAPDECSGADWLESASGLEAKITEMGIKRRPNELDHQLRVRVAAALGRGPWIDAVLKQAERIGGDHYRSVVHFFGDALLPADFV